MTVDEFQKKYHNYITDDWKQALADALKLRVVDEKGKERKVIPMQFGGKYCLMIDTAAGVVKELGVGKTPKK